MVEGEAHRKKMLSRSLPMANSVDMARHLINLGGDIHNDKRLLSKSAIRAGENSDVYSFYKHQTEPGT